jgi:23S rRNA (uracil1939-C5)-methyltransferase
MVKKAIKILEKINVHGTGAKGKAIGRAEDGKVVFMDYAAPGDVVDVQVTGSKRNYYEGHIVAWHSLGEGRTEPVCAHFGVCGGCKWQHLSYAQQLELKAKEVTENIRRIGGVEAEEILPIVPSEKSYGYRNKMEYSFSNKRWYSREELESGAELPEMPAAGFHAPKVWDKVVQIDQCHLQEDTGNRIRNWVFTYAQQNELSFYDARAHRGLMRSIMLRNNRKGQWMVLFQFGENKKAEIKDLLNKLQLEFPEIISLQYAINTKMNDSWYDLDIRLHSGVAEIEENMQAPGREAALRFTIGAKSFYQTNPEQAEKLYTVAAEMAGLTGNERVYDLYTGTGTIAQFVAHRCKEVVGIESVPQAIENARENCKLNGVSNCRFEVGDMRFAFSDDFLKNHGHPDVLITDPPRDGMHPKVVEQILKIAPKRIVYVSCNSATQARDIALMKEAYTVKKVQAVDMFPHTFHVESVVMLEKK